MLATIKDVLVQIADFFGSVGSFVIGYIKETISLFEKLHTTYEGVIDLLEKFFPVTLYGLLVTIISVVLILRVVGRF